MLIETHKVEVEILYTVFLQYVLRAYQLAQIQVVEETCLGQSEELTIIQSWAVSIDTCHADAWVSVLAHI